MMFLVSIYILVIFMIYNKGPTITTAQQRSIQLPMHCTHRRSTHNVANLIACRTSNEIHRRSVVCCLWRVTDRLEIRLQDM